MVDGGPAKYDLDLTVQPDNTPGLCKNDVNDNCCTCFKKATEDPGCYKIPCQAYGENPNGSYAVNGYCIGTNAVYSIYHRMKSSLISFHSKFSRQSTIKTYQIDIQRLKRAEYIIEIIIFLAFITGIYLGN